jgi:hypothetical protein
MALSAVRQVLAFEEFPNHFRFGRHALSFHLTAWRATKLRSAYTIGIDTCAELIGGENPNLEPETSGAVLLVA